MKRGCSNCLDLETFPNLEPCISCTVIKTQSFSNFTPKEKMMSCTGCYHIYMNEGSEPCFSCIDVESRPNYKPEEKIMNKPTNITCPTESQIIDGYKVNPELMEKLFPDVIKEHLENEKYFDLGDKGAMVHRSDNITISISSDSFPRKAFFLHEDKCKWSLERPIKNGCLYLVPTKS